MKRWPIILPIVATLGAVAALKHEPLMMSVIGWRTERDSAASRVDLLRDHVEIIVPEGEGPFPVVLQFHGCAGIRAPFQRQWADIAVAAGYAAVIVDSNGARGLDRQASLDRICAGKMLLGQERAGDVAAALAIAESDPRLDTSQTILTGWSHGAWSVMDFFTLEDRKAPPPGLLDWPQTNVRPTASVLFYPYCGPGARSRFAPWSRDVDTLVLLGDADEVVDATPCIKEFNRQADGGAPIDLVVYPGANHVFDDPFLEPEYIHWYNEDYFADAKARYAAFLLRIRTTAR